MLPRLRILAHPAAVIVSSLIVLVGSSGCGGDDGPALETTTVLEGKVERIVVATGTIEPAKEVEVRSRIAGIVERIHVDDGDEVEAGQLLLEIERDLLESQVQEAAAALQEARVEKRYAAKDLARAEELVRSGARSSQFLDDAMARSERSAAVVARATARHRTLSTQLGYATVSAPLAGRVLEVHTEEGNAISPVTAVTGGTLLVSLAGTSSLHLEGLVDENEVARIEVGQVARIRTEAFSDEIFEGRVSEIAPLGQRVQNVTYFEVEIEIVDSDAARLRPRMSGDADIVTEVVEGAVIVPENALRYRGDEIYVEVPNGDGPPERRDVRIGIVDGASVQVLEGIEAGAEIVLQ
jgi:RND family efflux transporter MFP subunit